MAREEEWEKEIEALEEQLREREASLPAHSVRPQQIVVIEELEIAIEEKKKELDELRRKRQWGSQVDWVRYDYVAGLVRGIAEKVIDRKPGGNQREKVSGGGIRKEIAWAWILQCCIPAATQHL